MLDNAPILQSQRSVAYADLWYRLREDLGAQMPQKTDLPLRQLAPFMPNMSMVQHEADGRARYVLFGTGLTNLFGRDLTGEYVEAPMTEEARISLNQAKAAFFNEYGPSAAIGRWTIGEAQTSSGRRLTFENLTLPYFEASAQAVRYMSLVTPLGTLDYGEGVVQRFPDHKSRMFNATRSRPDWLQLSPDTAHTLAATDVA